MEPKIIPAIENVKRGRGIYLLPNLFTTGALFCGFYAIVVAMDGMFDRAAMFMFIAMILDSLDGRVARLTNTQTAFGAEYDSLSDMVAFGVAPALVAYDWALNTFGKFGWMVAFCYAAAAALRLARFNIQGSDNKRFFQGLPSPSAAALVMGFIWVAQEYDTSGASLRWVMAIITLGAAMLMVCNIRFYSFKEIDFRGRVPFFVVLLVALVYAAVSLDPPLVLFACFLFYVGSGVFMSVWRWFKHQKRRRIKHNHLPPT